MVRKEEKDKPGTIKKRPKRLHTNCRYFTDQNPMYGNACYRFPPDTMGRVSRLNPAEFLLFKHCGEHRFKDED